jgi:hypothetical protein
MSRQIRCRRAVLAVLALAASGVAACSAKPVSPLPGEAPSAPPAASATTSAPASPAPRPSNSRKSPAPTHTSARPSRTHTLPPACLGAVLYTVDATGTDPLPRSLCLKVGAVLRVQHVVGNTLSAEPADKVSQAYEAGVVDVRFLEPATVRVTFPEHGTQFTITVVAVR